MYPSDEAAALAIGRQGYLEEPVVVINLVRELHSKKHVLKEQILKWIKGSQFDDWISDDTRQLLVRLPSYKTYAQSRETIARIVSEVIDEAKKDELALRRR